MVRTADKEMIRVENDATLSKEASQKLKHKGLHVEMVLYGVHGVRYG